MYGWINSPLNGCMDEWIDCCMDVCMYGQMNWLLYEWKDELTTVGINKWMNEWINERKDEWMNEWMNDWMNEWIINERMDVWMN